MSVKVSSETILHGYLMVAGFGCYFTRSPDDQITDQPMLGSFEKTKCFF